MHKISGNKGEWLWKDILLSACIAVGLSAGLCAVFSILIVKEILKVEWTEYIGLAVVFLSTLIGSKYLMKSTRERELWHPICSGVIYFLLLAAAHLIALRGPFGNVVKITVSILAGCSISVIRLNGKRTRRKRKFVMKNR